MKKINSKDMNRITRELQDLADSRTSLESKFNTYASKVRVIDTNTGEVREEPGNCYQTAVNRTKKLRGGN